MKIDHLIMIITGCIVIAIGVCAAFAESESHSILRMAKTILFMPVASVTVYFLMVAGYALGSLIRWINSP